MSAQAAELIADLKNRGVQLWEDGGSLRFRAPNSVMTDELKDRLKEHKAEILAELQTEDPEIGSAPDHRFDVFPLTPVQSAYVLGRRKAFDYGDVPCQIYIELESPPLDVDRLQNAWQLLTIRHPMLSATFTEDGQRIMAEVDPYRIPVHDLTGEDDATFRDHMDETRRAMDHRMFEPSESPMYELRLTQLQHASILHVSMDFLIADYVSAQILMDDLWLLYQGTDLPPLDISFRDYVLAAAGERSRGRYERSRTYWMDRINELAGPPTLPVRPRSAEEPGRFRRLSTALSREASERLSESAGRHGVTVTSTLLAAFSEVIGRWSATPRFCLNLTVLDRRPLHPDVAKLVGDFTAVSLLEVDTTPENTFSTRVTALQDRLWADLDHGAFTGVDVMRELARRRGRDAALMPVVFTSTVGMQGGGAEPEKAHGFRVAHSLSQTPQVWIDAQSLIEGGQIRLQWDVREGVMPDGVVDDMFEAFSAIVNELSSGDAVWTAYSPVALPAATVLSRRDAETRRAVPEGLLHDGVLAAARAAPDKVAVISGDRLLTYREVVSRAENVAAELRSRGVQAGDLVAVTMNKGWEQVVAVIGILLAGAVYLPIDAGQPENRRRRMLKDGGAVAVLGQSWMSTGEEVIHVDLLASDHVDVPLTPRSPDDLAYVIYTSGSTGDPKGVMISHRAAMNTIVDVLDRFEIDADDRVLGLANLGFDLSVFDIFGTLSAGGTLVLPDPARRGDPSHWAHLLANHEITVWNSVPAQLQMLDDYLSVEPSLRITSLRLALLSGDWIPVTLPEKTRRRIPGVKVISLGGATEAGIWSIYWPIQDEDSQRRSIPYGRPLANQAFTVVDPWMRPCPDHVPGELLISGASLAEGYLGDEAKTLDRFVLRDGERSYRTGDLGVYDNGVIEFLGRNDRQVKVRGHRIELSEIEHHLLRLDDVAAAHVTVDGRTPTEQRIVAFLQPARVEIEPPRDEMLIEHARRRAEHAVGFIEPSRLHEFMSALDRACLIAMVAALAESGVFTSCDRAWSTEEILKTTGAAGRHHRLVRRWLKVLTAEGIIVDTSEGYRASDPPVGTGDLAQAWELVEKLRVEEFYPKLLIDYFRASGEQLGSLLRDDADALDLLFREGEVETSYAAYRDNVYSRYVNHAVLGLLEPLVDGSTTEDRLSVLEVGAGVGGTSTVVVPELPLDRVDYFFTDVSQFFLGEARAKFGDALRYALFDINVDPVAQGYDLHAYDVVLCANVLHNSRDVMVVLERLRSLLTPGGWLVFIETTKENVQIMVSMEFMMPDKDPDKWDYDDLRRGLDQTFLSEDEWRKVLADAGADEIIDLPPATDPLADSGQRVFAARFNSDMARLDRDDVLFRIGSDLPDYMLPSAIRIVDDMPLTVNGKVDAKALSALIPEASEARPGGQEAPATELEGRVAQIWGDLLEVATVGPQDDFYDLGGDSLLLARLTGKMREELPEAKDYAYDVLMRAILRRPTVRGLAEQLEGAPTPPTDGDRSAQDPLVLLSDAPGEAADVLVHDGVGTLSAYRHLIEVWSSDEALLGLEQTVDTDVSDPTDGLIERRAREYTDRLLASGHERFNIVGYCMGGLVALEIARQLADAGATVESLSIVSSYALPQTIEDDVVLEYVFAKLLRLDTVTLGYPSDDVVGRVFAVLQDKGGRVGPGTIADVAGEDREIVELTFGALARVPQAERLGAIARQVDEGLTTGIDSIYATFRHSMQAVSKHQPGAYLGDITFLREEDEAAFFPWFRQNMTEMWERVCLGDLKVVDVPGNHFSCLEPPHVQVVERVLAQARGAVS